MKITLGEAICIVAIGVVVVELPSGTRWSPAPAPVAVAARAGDAAAHAARTSTVRAPSTAAR